jgi:hypothetical protein
VSPQNWKDMTAIAIWLGLCIVPLTIALVILRAKEIRAAREYDARHHFGVRDELRPGR